MPTKDPIKVLDDFCQELVTRRVPTFNGLEIYEAWHSIKGEIEENRDLAKRLAQKTVLAAVMENLRDETGAGLVAAAMDAKTAWTIARKLAAHCRRLRRERDEYKFWAREYGKEIERLWAILPGKGQKLYPEPGPVKIRHLRGDDG